MGNAIVAIPFSNLCIGMNSQIQMQNFGFSIIWHLIGIVLELKCQMSMSRFAIAHHLVLSLEMPLGDDNVKFILCCDVCLCVVLMLKHVGI